MIPKRKEKNLLNGLVWIDTRTFRIQRIEGTPTKKPSWWIKQSLHHAAIYGSAWSVAAYLHEGWRGCPSVWELPLNWRRRRIAGFFLCHYEWRIGITL